MLAWQKLDNAAQLNTIDSQSSDGTVAIFKHSTRCSISSMALARIKKRWDVEKIPIYVLDLISYREISNEIATRYGVRHESPQLILVKDGKAIYDSSHMSINAKDALQLA